jgi:hypothetical protein
LVVLFTGDCPARRSGLERSFFCLENENRVWYTREDPGGGRHHFAPDDEDASEYENYHSPDHTYKCGRGALL